MKKDLRMNAKSPDPDDLAEEMPPDPGERDLKEREHQPRRTAQQDRSAPHIPPLQKGKIRSNE